MFVSGDESGRVIALLGGNLLLLCMSNGSAVKITDRALQTLRKLSPK
jgi:hypothetical protein